MRTILCAVAIAVTAGNHTALAQEFSPEIDLGVGVWIPFLPDYQAASIHDLGGGTTTFVPNAFTDQQDGAGAIFHLTGRQELWHDTAIMMTGFYANANIDSSRTIADPAGPDEVVMVDLDGLGSISTATGGPMYFGFDSETQHWGSDILLLRDHYHGGGRLSWGGGFSYMGFEQDFLLMGQTPLFTTMYYEKVETNYFGGKLAAFWNDNSHHYPIIADFAIGLYYLKADYDGMNEVHNGDEEGPMMRLPGAWDTLGDFAGTIEGHVATECTRGILTVRPRLGFRWISDMPVIEHPMLVGDPAANLSTTDAFFLTFDLEFLLW